MFQLDGIFIFKLVILSTLYELYVQKHVSIQLQNSILDKFYKEQWFETCTRVIRNGNINSIMELVDFCMFLFKKFHRCRKRIFKNPAIRTEAFRYMVIVDKQTGFSRKRFIKFLREIEKDYKSDHMKKFINEIIHLLEFIELEIPKLCERNNNVNVNFSDCKKFKNIFEHASVQYEFTDSNDNDIKTFIHTVFSNKENNLKYQITSN